MVNEKSAVCRRCGKQFDPEAGAVKQAKFCDACCMRNLLDGLGLPTPPEMLDRYTKHPTLSDREFRTRLAATETA